MKCVKVDNKISRISDEKAASIVRSGKGTFVPRSEWKKNVRDVK